MKSIPALGLLLLAMAVLADAATAEPSAIQTIKYSGGMQEATINKSGEIEVERTSPGDWYKGKTGNQKTTAKPAELKSIFDLAQSTEVTNSETSYMPKPETFEYYGHSMITKIGIVDGKGKTIHSVSFSNKAEKPVPQKLIDLSAAISILLEKKFGPAPPLIIN